MPSCFASAATLSPNGPLMPSNGGLAKFHQREFAEPSNEAVEQ